jgi:hypothetical protein
VSGLEVKTELDFVVGLKGTYKGPVVRVLYRRPPTRRWTRFLLVPDEDQTLEELKAHATEATIFHDSRAGGQPPWERRA